MRKITLSILLLLFITHNFSNAQTIPQKGRLIRSINLIFAPELGFLKTSSDFETLNNYNDKFLAPALGYNAGATLNYSLSNNWRLQSGLIFNARSYTREKCPVCWPGPAPDCGQLITLVKYPSTKYTSAKETKGYLYVPFNFEYLVKK